MCNLFKIMLARAEAAHLARAMVREFNFAEDNQPPVGDIYPDYATPIIRLNADGERELVEARWGMPSPQFALVGKKVDKGITNIRNVSSPHWRRWLSPANRCLVPFTAFSEPGRSASGVYEPVWFTLQDEQPAFFAGVWTNWTCTRKLKEGEVTCDLFGFLTTEPNAEVGEVHPKAMPVILTEPEEWETWLTAPWPIASQLQRPLPDGALKPITPLPSKERVGKELF
jgi:putative SOS response-associated peptidase YedK